MRGVAKSVRPVDVHPDGYPPTSASHIKPWAACATDAERRDVFNGLLLEPHLDAAFDAGFITISADGTVRVSDALPLGARSSLGLGKRLRVHGFHRGHERYLPWYRSGIFRRGGKDAS